MMPRTPARKASAKRVHKAKRAENRSSPKAKGATTRRARAAPKRRARGAAKAKPKAARPRRLSPERKAEILRKVARPHKGDAHAERDALPVEEHQHDDPRLLEIASGNPGSTRGPKMNYGEYKNKAVARMDPPGNWFRKAPKSPSK